MHNVALSHCFSWTIVFIYYYYLFFGNFFNFNDLFFVSILAKHKNLFNKFNQPYKISINSTEMILCAKIEKNEITLDDFHYVI